MRIPGALLLALLAASAASVAGAEPADSFAMTSPAHLPAGARVSTLSPILILEEPASLHSFVLQAPRLNLVRSATNYTGLQSTLGVPGVFVENGGHEFRLVLTNATVRVVAADPSGIVALEGSGTGGIALAAPTALSVASDVSLRGGTSTAVPDPPGLRERAEGDWVAAQVGGEAWMDGPGTLSLFGASIEVAADEGVHVLSSGERMEGQLLGNSVHAWIHLEFEASRVGAVFGEGLLLAQEAFAAWQGKPLLPTPGASDARREAVLRPDPSQRGTLLVETWEVQDAPLLAGVGGWLLDPARAPWLVAPIAFSAFGFALGAWVQRRTPSVGAEACVAAAGLAITRERWAEAAAWLEHARRLAPTSARIHADLGYALLRLGEPARAFEALREARRLGDDGGETLMQGALAAVQADRLPHEAEEWLRSALDRMPTLVTEAEDLAFEPLRGRPGYEEAILRAWASLDDEALRPA